MTRTVSWLALAIIASATIAWAQATPGVQPSFRSGVDVVPLDVCVRDASGRFVPGLEAGDFLVLDENAPRHVEFFAAGSRVPLAVVLMVDRSASMSGVKIDRARAAAHAFIGTLDADDLLEIVAFSDRTERPLGFSTDRAAAGEAVSRLEASGTTALFESLVIALRDLARLRRHEAREYRQAVVILSDGEDTKSLVAFEDVLDEARRSGVLVYAVSLRADHNGRALPTPRELFQLANDTGGRAQAVERLETLGALYQEIGAELRHLYRLGFLPPGTATDGRWRRVSVRVPSVVGAQARTRAGYYAPRLPRPLVMGGARSR